jgi:2-oxoglutarate/2-oxoacid ferredoxin oxidoreductase subunit beta
MSYIKKPNIKFISQETNKIGLTKKDYEGAMSTLCAGCGHDSVTAAIVQTFYEMSFEPHRAAKISGIGCSSKTPAYFLGQSHGFNSVHGRMPSVATGANAANKSLKYIGISGDGDSLSIGAGQLIHAIRRNINMVYILENNGVYGLTKGQFSASADKGSASKGGVPNAMNAIDPVALGLSIGATFVARSFSGDKAQLVPILKAALSHNGFALIDVISPCVTFNNHKGSTKSYPHTRQKYFSIADADYISGQEEIQTDYPAGTSKKVEMHDGSSVTFSKIAKDYDPTDRGKASAYLNECREAGTIATGLLYIEENSLDMHEIENTVETPLNEIPYSLLCPGNEQLQKLQSSMR